MHFLKILDRHTEIYAAILRLVPQTEDERKNLMMHGWGPVPEADYLILMKLNGGVEAQVDPFKWDLHKYGRTMRTAHMFLNNVFHQNGWEYIVDQYNVVDVQSL